MGVPDIVKMLTESGTTVVVLAIGLWVFLNRARRDEVERRELFRHVLHGDGNGQAGLAEIGEMVKRIDGSTTLHSERIGMLEEGQKALKQGHEALRADIGKVAVQVAAIPCRTMADGTCPLPGGAA